MENKKYYIPDLNNPGEQIEVTQQTYDYVWGVVLGKENVSKEDLKKVLKKAPKREPIEDEFPPVETELNSWSNDTAIQNVPDDKHYLDIIGTDVSFEITKEEHDMLAQMKERFMKEVNNSQSLNFYELVIMDFSKPEIINNGR